MVRLDVAESAQVNGGKPISFNGFDCTTHKFTLFGVTIMWTTCVDLDE